MTDALQTDKYVVKFKAPKDKKAKLVAKVTATGDVIPTGLHIHAARMTKESADKLVAAIQAAGWTAEIESV